MVQKYNELYDPILGLMSEAVVICDANSMKILDCNNSAELLYGYTKEEFVKLFYTSLVVNPVLAEETFSQVKTGKNNQNSRVYHRKKNGSLFPAEVKSDFYKIGKLQLVFSIVNDITELDIKDNRYKKLFDNISSGVAVYEVVGDAEDFIFKDFNKAGERIDNDKRESLIGKSIYKVRPGIEKFGLIDVFKKVWKSGEPDYLPVTEYKDDKLKGWYENFVYKLPSGEIVAIFNEVTESKMMKLEKELFIENSDDMLCVIDSNQKFKQVNSTWHKTLGWTVEEMLGKPFTDFIHPEDSTATISFEKIDKSKNNIIKNFENRFRCKDGSYHWLTWNIFFVAKQKLTFTTAKDITEAKKKNDELILQKEMLANINEGIVIVRLDDSKIVFTNSEFEKMFGYNTGELIGLNVNVLNAPVKNLSAEEMKRKVMKNLNKYGSWEGEILNIKKDRTHFWCHSTVKYFESSLYGKVGISIHLDINEKKLMESHIIRSRDELATVVKKRTYRLEKINKNLKNEIIIRKETETKLKRIQKLLLESEAKYKTLFENNLTGVYRSTVGGNILDCNYAFAKILGYSSADEIIKSPVYNFYVNKYSRKHFLTKLKEKGLLINFELQVKKKDGSTIWILENVHLLANKVLLGAIIDITENKKLEYNLKKNQESLAEAQQVAHVGHWEWDIKTNDLYWSDEVYRIFGYTPQEFPVTYSTFLGCVHPDDREFVKKSVNMTLSKSEKYSIDHKIILPDDAIRIVHELGKVVYDDNKKPLRMIGTVQDITEQKKYLSRLHLFEAFVENANDMVVITDAVNINKPGPRILYVNKSFEKITGYTLDKVIGKSPRILQGSKTDKDKLKEIKGALIKNIPIQTILINYRKNRDEFYNEISIFPIKDSDGNTVNYMSIERDITKRVNAEEELKRNKIWFESIFNSLNEAVFVVSLNRKIVNINKAAERIYGYTLAELKNRFTEVLHVDHKHFLEFDRLISIAFSQNRTASFEFNTKRKDGRIFPTEHTVSLLKNENNESIGIVSVARDISLKKKIEKELRKSEELLKTMFEASPVPLLLSNFSDGKVLLANRRLSELFMIPVDKLIGRKTPDYYLNHYERNEILKELLRTSFIKNKELLVKKADGTIFWCLITLRVLEIDNEVMILTGFADITARKRMEEALNLEKKFSEQLINSLPGIFILFDKKGNIERWNNNFINILGYSNKYIRSHKPLDFITKVSLPLAKKKIKEGFSKGTTQADLVLLNNKGKEIPYFFTASKIIFGKNLYLLAVGFDITELRGAQEELKSSRETLRKLAGSLENAMEEERIRIAREIHDVFGQNLTILKIDLLSLAKDSMLAHPNIKKQIKTMLDTINESIESIRKLASELRPEILDQLGLSAAIQWQTEQYKKRMKLKFKLNVPINTVTLSSNKSTAAFRIYQEAITNIIRHSHANKVTITLKVVNRDVLLEIQDNGIGIKSKNLSHKSSLGILGMKERALLNGGKLNIMQNKKGTKLSLILPADKI